jgi:hypothetical protein
MYGKTTTMFNKTHMGKSKKFVDLAQETCDMWRLEDVTNVVGQL